jgi:lipopolysaccharide transport system permease protein
MVAVPTAIGLWLSALAIRYRDVKFAMPFVLRMLIYTAPILYSASSIPENYRLLYSLNPLVGVIEGFRSCLLGTPIEYEYIIPGVITTIIILISGAVYFKKMESIFVDVI